MKGAVHGVATTAANNPVANARKTDARGRAQSAAGAIAPPLCGARAAPPATKPPRLLRLKPTSKMPEKFKPNNKNNRTSAVTTAGDCNWKPQPMACPASRSVNITAARPTKVMTTPAAKANAWRRAPCASPPASSRKPNTLRLTTGKTQGIKFNNNPPTRAPAITVKNVAQAMSAGSPAVVFSDSLAGGLARPGAGAAISDSSAAAKLETPNRRATGAPSASPASVAEARTAASDRARPSNTNTPSSASLPACTCWSAARSASCARRRVSRQRPSASSSRT